MALALRCTLRRDGGGEEKPKPNICLLCKAWLSVACSNGSPRQFFLTDVFSLYLDEPPIMCVYLILILLLCTSSWPKNAARMSECVHVSFVLAHYSPIISTHCAPSQSSCLSAPSPLFPILYWFVRVLLHIVWSSFFSSCKKMPHTPRARRHIKKEDADICLRCCHRRCRRRLYFFALYLRRVLMDNWIYLLFSILSLFLCSWFSIFRAWRAIALTVCMRACVCMYRCVSCALMNFKTSPIQKNSSPHLKQFVCLCALIFSLSFFHRLVLY